MKATKPTQERQQLEALLERVERLLAETQLGVPLDPASLSPLEYDLVIFYHRQRQSLDRQWQLQLAMLQIKAGGQR